MRLAAAGLVALLVAGSVLAAEVITVEIQEPDIDAVAGGDEVTRGVKVEHACPVPRSSAVTFSAPPELGVKVQPPELFWKRCDARQERSQAYVALFVKPRADTPAGVYDGTLTVTSATGEKGSAPFTVKLPYSAAVTFQGPKITTVQPGSTVSQTFNVTVVSNGATQVGLATTAPPGWGVLAPQSLSTTRGGAGQKLAWPVTLTVPPDARGDAKVVFTATPRATTGGDLGAPATYEWFARVPAQPITGSGTADTTEAAVADEATPAWVWGVGLVLAAGVALWWSRR